MYPPWRAARRAGRLDEPVTDIQYTDSNTSREKTSAREQCGSVGRAGVGCGLRSILSGYSALWKHRTDREKRLPGPGYTVSRQRARPLHARQAPGRQGDLRNTICTTGGSPWSTMPTSRRTRGEAHGAQIPRAPNIWVASMRSVRGCARGCVRGAHEILHELLMRSSMSCSSQVKSSQVKSSQV